MQIIGIINLTDVFGDSRATWKTRIESGMPVFEHQPEHSGKPHVFDSQDVHAWLLEQASGRPGGSLDPRQERAQLDAARRRLCELQIAEREKDLMPQELVVRVWGRMTGAARARLLALPYRLAQAALAATDFVSIETSATDLITEALLELHDYNPADYLPMVSGDEQRLAEFETAAETDSQPVGRQRKKAQPRGECGTGPVEH